MDGNDIKRLFENTPWPEPGRDMRANIMERAHGRMPADIIALKGPSAATISASRGMDMGPVRAIRLALLAIMLCAGLIVGFLTLDTTARASAPPYFAGTGTMMAQALAF